jgi:predicted dehydrogenase
MRRFAVGLTGHGVADRLHAPMLRSTNRVDLVRLHMGSGSNLLRSRTSVAPNALDLICIGIPPSEHERFAKAAVQLSPLILCEKPVGITSEVPETLKRMFQGIGAACIVNYQLRFLPVIRELRNELMNLGPIELRVSYDSNAYSRPRQGWSNDPRNGGGIDYAVGSHLLDLVQFLRGPLLEVSCTSPHCGPAGHDHFRHFSVWATNRLGDVVLITLNGATDYGRFVIGVRSAQAAFELDVIGSRRRAIVGTPAEISPWAIHGLDRLASSGTGPWSVAFSHAVGSLLATDALSPTGFASLDDAIGIHVALAATKR